MKKYLFILLILVFCLYTGCERSTDYIGNTKNIQTINDNVYYYLSDSIGSIQTQFLVGQDIFFNFGIINKQDSVLNYTKGHGGPPIVSFVIFKSDSIFGISDYGYAYPAIVVGGKIQPNDTLEYSVSWYLNPYHPNILVSGKYYTTIHPYIWFDDFNLSSYLDTVYFEIVAE
jgi:hypothetical protein